MNILDATKQIIRMFKLSQNPSINEWNEAFQNFEKALDDCNNINILLKCIFYDNNWYLPFEYRIKLIEKTKYLGANSYDFLADYYSYKVSYLDPGEEYDKASQLLDQLNSNHNIKPR